MSLIVKFKWVANYCLVIFISPFFFYYNKIFEKSQPEKFRRDEKQAEQGRLKRPRPLADSL